MKLTENTQMNTVLRHGSIVSQLETNTTRAFVVSRTICFPTTLPSRKKTTPIGFDFPISEKHCWHVDLIKKNI